MTNDTQDLDARVAEVLDSEALNRLAYSKRTLVRRLIRDLHAALKAARGEEFEAWAVLDHGGGLNSVRKTRQDAEWASTFYSEYGSGYTVRRVLCRIAPDDGETP